MVSVAEAEILGVTWQNNAYAHSYVGWDDRPPGDPPAEDFSNNSYSSNAPGASAVAASAAAQQGGTSTYGTTLSRMTVSGDFRSGSFSSNSRIGNSIGPLGNVFVGSDAYGSGRVLWETNDDAELSFAWGFLKNDPSAPDAVIRVSDRNGPSDYSIPGTDPNVNGAFGMRTLPVYGVETGLAFVSGAAVTTLIDASENNSFAVVWGRNGLPGLSAMDAFMPQAGELPGIFNFTIPVMQDYGVGNTLYFDPVFATGYEYRVDGSRFASFTLPGALPGGDDLFQLEFNGVFYDLMAGNVFDFTSIDPLGASQFFLRGIDLSEMIDPNLNPPFVSGLSFTTQGIADVSQIALTSDVTAVPEPSSFCIMMALMGIAGVYRWRTITSG